MGCLAPTFGAKASRDSDRAHERSLATVTLYGARPIGEVRQIESSSGTRPLARANDVQVATRRQEELRHDAPARVSLHST